MGKIADSSNQILSVSMYHGHYCIVNVFGKSSYARFFTLIIRSCVLITQRKFVFINLNDTAVFICL